MSCYIFNIVDVLFRNYLPEVLVCRHSHEDYGHSKIATYKVKQLVEQISLYFACQSTSVFFAFVLTQHLMLGGDGG